MRQTPWTLDDPTSRDAFERIVHQLGGHALADQRERARQAQARLADGLDPALRPLYLDAQDAASDASAAREDAAVQAALLLGAGLGAALATRPDHEATATLKAAAPALLAVLSAPVEHSHAVEAIQSALDGLRRMRMTVSG